MGNHQTRSEIAIAFAEADGPEGYGDYAQGYGWRILRDGLEAQFATDVNYAWPTAEIAVMGPEGAVDIVYKRDSNRQQTGMRCARRRSKSSAIASRILRRGRPRLSWMPVNPPRETRKKLIQALESSKLSATRIRQRTWEHTAMRST